MGSITNNMQACYIFYILLIIIIDVVTNIYIFMTNKHDAIIQLEELSASFLLFSVGVAYVLLSLYSLASQTKACFSLQLLQLAAFEKH